MAVKKRLRQLGFNVSNNKIIFFVVDLPIIYGTLYLMLIFFIGVAHPRFKMPFKDLAPAMVLKPVWTTVLRFASYAFAGFFVMWVFLWAVYKTIRRVVKPGFIRNLILKIPILKKPRQAGVFRLVDDIFGSLQRLPNVYEVLFGWGESRMFRRNPKTKGMTLAQVKAKRDALDPKEMLGDTREKGGGRGALGGLRLFLAHHYSRIFYNIDLGDAVGDEPLGEDAEEEIARRDTKVGLDEDAYIMDTYTRCIEDKGLVEGRTEEQRAQDVKDCSSRWFDGVNYAFTRAFNSVAAQMSE